MKTLLMSLLFVATSALAVPPPQEQQEQQQQQQQQDQDQQCRYQSCRPPRPQPQAFTCHARMVDCYNRPLYTYWGRGPQYQGACHFALSLCRRDASMGYGGYGARCYILGK